MSALFRCLDGHLWEDVFDAPSLVEGQIRQPGGPAEVEKEAGSLKALC
jgi:hypothetical protein